MDCDTARPLLAFRRPAGPSELAPEDAAALEGHLAGCPGCAAHARRLDLFDAAVSRAIQAVEVPSTLRANLLAQLDRRAVTRWRKRAGGFVAAGLLVAAGLGGGYAWRQAARPTLDADAVAGQLDDVARFPESSVAEWLKAQGLPTELPAPLDYRNYAFHGTEPLLGRNVPVVVFQLSRPGLPPDTLKLFVVRGRDFKLDGVKDARGSFYAVRVLHDDRTGSGIVYLAAFTTPTIDPFLKRPLPPT